MNTEIILLTHEYPPFYGGVATYCHEITRAAVSLGLPWKIWAPKNAARIPEGCVELLECSMRLSPWNLFKMTVALAKRERALAGKNLILGSVLTHQAAMLLTDMGRLKACRLSSLLYGSEILKFQRHRVWRVLAPRFFKKVATVFVDSEFTQRLAERNFPGVKVMVAPCACNSTAIREISPTQETRDEKFRILTLARIHPRKGQLETAKSLALLPPHLKNRIIYTLGGKGDAPYLQEILTLCKKNEIHCDILGAVPPEHLAETYARCDCFVMTSRLLEQSVEGFGMSYLEAGWHGKPSVAFRTGGVAEAVLHEKTGILVKENDLAGVSHAIQKLMEDQPHRLTLGRQAAAFARSFSWQHTAQIIAQTLA